MNQEISPPIEVVLIKEEIADNCVLQDGNGLKGEEIIEEHDTISAIENPENMHNIQYSSNLCEERHIENFLNRVKKESAFNLIPEEIQIKDERLSEATDSDSEDKSYNKLLNEETNKLGGKIDGLNDENVDCARRHKCNQCLKAFPCASTLQRHSRIHTGEKPFECDICHTKFKQMNNLTVHKRIHTNERPFKCPLCNKIFTQSCNLSRHMRVHSGEKPFQCQICQYKCAQTNVLKRHMRIHTGEKPFTCKHCQKAFNQSGSLRMHMRTKHNDKI